MITVRTKLEDLELNRACLVSELEAELDDINEQVKIYYRGDYIGFLLSVCGISEDEFVTQIKKKETNSN